MGPEIKRVVFKIHHLPIRWSNSLSHTGKGPKRVGSLRRRHRRDSRLPVPPWLISAKGGGKKREVSSKDSGYKGRVG